MKALTTLEQSNYQVADLNGGKIKLNIDENKSIHAIDLGNCVILSKNDYYAIVALTKTFRKHTKMARDFAKAISNIPLPEHTIVQNYVDPS